MSLSGQRFTVQIPPPSQTATTKTGKAPPPAAAGRRRRLDLFLLRPTVTPSSPAVSNVLINPSLINSKNILITTNMVAQNSGSESLKRKHEDDDYDAL